MTASDVPATGTHILVVTKSCEGHNDPGPCDPDCIEYTAECPGVTEQCRMWQTCPVADCDANDRGFRDDGGIAHGVEHTLIADQWMTWTDRCFVQANESLREAGEMVADKPGRYPVSHDFGDGTDLYLRLVAEAVNV